MRQGKPLARKTPLRAKGGPARRRCCAPVKVQRGHDPRPEKKPRRLRSTPPKATPEERQTREVVEARSDGFCEKCGTPGATDKAHRIARGVGGGWEPVNILDLCRRCHQYNHANPARAYEGGWHLRGGSSPKDSPVLFHHDGEIALAYLHHDGTHTWLEEIEGTA